MACGQVETSRANYQYPSRLPQHAPRCPLLPYAGLHRRAVACLPRTARLGLPKATGSSPGRRLLTAAAFCTSTYDHTLSNCPAVTITGWHLRLPGPAVYAMVLQLPACRQFYCTRRAYFLLLSAFSLPPHIWRYCYPAFSSDLPTPCLRPPLPLPMGDKRATCVWDMHTELMLNAWFCKLGGRTCDTSAGHLLGPHCTRIPTLRHWRCIPSPHGPIPMALPVPKTPWRYRFHHFHAYRNCVTPPTPTRRVYTTHPRAPTPDPTPFPRHLTCANTPLFNRTCVLDMHSSWADGLSFLSGACDAYCVRVGRSGSRPPPSQQFSARHGDLPPSAFSTGQPPPASLPSLFLLVLEPDSIQFLSRCAAFPTYDARRNDKGMPLPYIAP